MVKDILVMFYTSQGWDTSARVHMRIHFRYFWNGWTHCADIWCVVVNQLITYLGNICYECSISVRPHVHNSFPFLDFSGSTGRFIPKYGVLLDP